jgi:hypothetical protein
MTLYHVSEDPDITLFEPRRINETGEPLVWAITAERLCNYLVPRDCPRVTFYAGPLTSSADRDRFLGASSAVVAIEDSWLSRLQSCRLVCYHFPGDGFTSFDVTAGYFVSRTAVKPVRVECIEDAPGALRRRRVDLRVLAGPDLRTLRDAVVASTLEFSIIRWRNVSGR